MISCDGDHCTLRGPLTMDNVVAVLDEGSRLLPGGPHIVVDLAGVTEVDSAAVSLLLEWRRAARRSGRKVEFANLSTNLKSLAALYGVSDLLGG